MPGETVTIKNGVLEKFRKEQVLSRSGLFDKLSVHSATGRKLLRGEPVRLSIARKVAAAMGVDIQALIKSWK